MAEPHEIKLRFNGVIGEVQSKWVPHEDDDINFDSGSEDGENKIQEETKEPAEYVNDVIQSFNYVEITPFSEADFNTYIQGYMEKIKKYLEKENSKRIDNFKTNAVEAVKWILDNFDSFKFFQVREKNPEAAIIFAHYRSEDIAFRTPKFVYFMDGIKIRDTSKWL